MTHAIMPYSGRYALRDRRTHGPFVGAILAGAASTISASVAGTLLFGSVVAHFLITTALGIALNLLTPKPSTADGGYKINPAGAAQPQAIIYGRTVVGGPRVYDEVTDGNKYLHRVIALAGHECDAIEAVYFDDEELTLDGSGNVTAPSKWANKARILTHLGDQTTADSTLVAESDGLWSTDHIGYGICYIYARFTFDRDAFPRGVPKITAKVRGKKIYDPRTGTTAWTDNASLCFRDYLSSGYGLRATSDKLDDDNFIVAANVCDESVALAAGGTESRYTINGSFTTNTAPRGVIVSMHTAVAGYPAYGQGAWKTFPGVYVAATKTLTEDDLRSDINIAPRHTRATNFNAVRGLFSGEETNWKDTDYPVVDSATFLAEDGGYDNTADLDLPFTSTSTMAQRIAKISLYRNREQITVNATFGLNAFDVEIGEIVQLTYSDFGWSAKEFECVSWKFIPDKNSDPQVELVLREISSGVFDWSADEATFLTNNTNLPDAFIVATAGLTPSSELRSINEKVSGVLIVDVTSSDAGYVQQFEVQAKKSGDLSNGWVNLGTASGNRFEMLDVEDTDYDIRARVINTFGVRGSWTTMSNYSVAVFAAPPSDVSNFQINVIGGVAHLTWDAIPDLDLSSYIIRHSPKLSGAVYSGAQTVAPKVSRPATSIALPYRSGTYFIKAKDKIGNESVNAASIVTNVGEIEGLNAIQTITESTGYAGDFIGVTQNWDSFLLLDPQNVIDNGDFADGLTTGWTGNNTTLSVESDATFDKFMRVTGNDISENYAWEAYTVEIGKQYQFEVWAKKGTRNAVVGVGTSQGGIEYGSGVSGAPAAWRKITIDFTPTQTTVYVTAYPAVSGVGESATYADFKIRDVLTNGYLLQENGDGIVLDSAASSGLRIHDLTVSSPSGEYLFDTVLDLGDKYTSRVEAHLEFYRYDSSGALFDDGSGLFDSTSGLFDGPEYSDANVKLQISLTDDDPTDVESGYGPADDTLLQGDSVANFWMATADRSGDALVVIDVEMPETTNAGEVILDGGNDDTAGREGFFCGFAGGYYSGSGASEAGQFVVRFGGPAIGHPTDCAKIDIDPSLVAGRNGRLIIECKISTKTLNVWFWDSGATMPELLGTDTASVAMTYWWSIYAGGCGLVGADNRVIGYEATTGLGGSDIGGHPFTGVIKEARFYFQNSTSPTFAAWSDWIDFTAGDFAARGMKFKAVLESDATSVSPMLTSLAAKVDMPDRSIAGDDIVSGVGAYTVTFSPAFKGLSGVGISAQGLATGDYYDITAKSETGFTIHFKDSSGSSISRTFDYVASGWGKVVV